MKEYEVQNINLIDSPALLVYPERIVYNIQTMLEMVDGDADKLIPHVKTHKMAEVARMQVEAGITKFKCSTIAEAEMLADTGARHVLLAYQLTGPKIRRFAELAEAYDWVEWASLVDNWSSAEELASGFEQNTRPAVVYIDVNIGMNRTGHRVNEELKSLYLKLKADERFDLRGFHAYDGHVNDADVATRQANADAGLTPLEELANHLEQEGEPRPVLIVGGTPTFTNYARRPNVWCSPGTCLLWDWSYGKLLAEQSFKWAALLITRVISKPSLGEITIDLGHKAVSAENPLAKRVKFLNLNGYELVGQSEEHLVLRVQNWEEIQIGDVLYGVPYHICPTVALHDEAQVIVEGEAIGRWAIDARKRRITY